MPSEWRSLLRALTVERAIRFVVIGSRGVELHHPEGFAAREPAAVDDVDILILPDDLQDVARWCAQRGATVTSWGEPFEQALAKDALAGRFYVRACFAHTQLDATYENPRLDLRSLYPRARWVDGIPACPEHELWLSKLLKDPAKALRFAEDHGVAIPSDAIERAYAAMRNEQAKQ